jgi:hypothetical protein
MKLNFSNRHGYYYYLSGGYNDIFACVNGLQIVFPLHKFGNELTLHVNLKRQKKKNEKKIIVVRGEPNSWYAKGRNISSTRTNQILEKLSQGRSKFTIYVYPS